MNDLIIEHWSSVPVPSFSQHNVRGVKITHIPSGVTATCESERSPHANRAIALRELQEKLKEFSAAAESDVSHIVKLLDRARSSVDYQMSAQNQNHEAGRKHYAYFQSLLGEIDAAIAAYRKQGGDL